LVRLVVFAGKGNLAPLAGFNSRLVRLVAEPVEPVEKIIRVSIPDWCDW